MQEIIKVLELDAIPVTDESSFLHFRIEILKDLCRHDCYRARLLRWDAYRIMPSFGKTDTADEDLLILDPFWDHMGATASTARGALDLLLTRLREQLPDADIPDSQLVGW